MAEFLNVEKAVKDTSFDQDGRTILIDENQKFVVQGQFRSPQKLDEFCQSILPKTMEVGGVVILDDTAYLRFSPYAIYVVSDRMMLDDFAKEYQNNFTDLSHGKCMLIIRGNGVFDIFLDYSAADLMNYSGAGQSMVKTRFIDYEVVLWWAANDQIQLLIDRSYAQSFVDFLSSLIVRQNLN